MSILSYWQDALRIYYDAVRSFIMYLDQRTCRVAEASRRPVLDEKTAPTKGAMADVECFTPSHIIEWTTVIEAASIKHTSTREGMAWINVWKRHSATPKTFAHSGGGCRWISGSNGNGETRESAQASGPASMSTLDIRRSEGGSMPQFSRPNRCTNIGE